MPVAMTHALDQTRNRDSRFSVSALPRPQRAHLCNCCWEVGRGAGSSQQRQRNLNAVRNIPLFYCIINYIILCYTILYYIILFYMKYHIALYETKKHPAHGPSSSYKAAATRWHGKDKRVHASHSEAEKRGHPAGPVFANHMPFFLSLIMS